MKIFDRFENNKYVIGYERKVILDVFTDSAGYRQADGTYNSNVGYFIYEGSELIYHKRKDYTNKTNNFGELKAIDLALKHIKKEIPEYYKEINIYSDSLLSINCLTTYLPSWLKSVKNGVMYNSSKQPVKNQDIIWSILETRKFFDKNNIKINIYFVRSHSPRSKIKYYHALYCKDNKVDITLEAYSVIRDRNAYCDAFIKN